MDITIRQASADDLESMLAWRGHSPAMRDGLTQAFAQILVRSRVIFLACSGTQLVGTVQMALEHDDPDLIRDAVYLQSLEVHQDFLRYGIASRLNQTLIAQAKQEGYARVTLMVEPENVAALALYAKLGFRVFKASEYIWDGQVLPVLCMELEL